MNTYLGSLFSELACSFLAWIFLEPLTLTRFVRSTWSSLHVVRLFCLFIFHIGDFSDYCIKYRSITVSDFSIVFPFIHIIGVD